MMEEEGLWIFGYGSLCWNPGFEYKKSMTGYVKGFCRRFWQGNTTHRGTEDKPGRVVTLIEDKDEITYGRVFQIKGETALSYLKMRECTLGGYLTKFSTFYSRDGKSNFPVLIYIATNNNKHWMGEAPLQTIAMQILECEGPSGHNAEYLLRLADFMHRYVPEAIDEHLFILEKIVRTQIKELNICINKLMGNRMFALELLEIDEELVTGQNDEENNDNVPVNARPENSFEYISRVPTKLLRCLKP
ncbi:hypothetical protein PV325_011009 [Microctonus aethiopoides]|nr:hypothetical protein PV325_011009 [Microctonus aethiopoides]